MIFTYAQKQTDSAISQFINEAREAESSRNLVKHQEIFKPFWENIELDPDFSIYDDLQKAELYRLSGYFISFYGKSKGIRSYQERAKNFLTISIELFSKLELKDNAAEATIILALCYFYEGAIIESETILEEISNKYRYDYLHPVYLKSCINRLVLLHWKSHFQKALEIIHEIEIPVEFCNDRRLIYMFHIQAGMIYRGINQFDEAIYHYHKSIETAEELNNWTTVAMNHNNLAFLYKIQNNFEAAHHHVEISIQILKDQNQIGWLPHSIDTKALIYFAENKFVESLRTIDEAIEILETGEDYAVLIDAMWNKVRCYLGLHQQDQAILLFAELAKLAQVNIGEVAVKKYTKLFTDLIYIKQDNSLEDEVRRFKKMEIVNALRQTDFNIEETAKKLQYSTTNKLIKVLNNEFPELYDEIGIQPRTVQPKIKKVKRLTNDAVEKGESTSPKFVNQLNLRNVKLEFDPVLNIKTSPNIKTFYCSQEKMSELFKINFDAVLAVAPFNQIVINQSVLIKKSLINQYSLARIAHDDNFDIFYVIDQNAPFSLDEVEIIGKPIGYCSFEEADTDKLYFKPFPNS